MCVLSRQSCLTLCSPKDCSPPGSSVHGVLQARPLEWVAMLSSIFGTICYKCIISIDLHSLIISIDDMHICVLLLSHVNHVRLCDPIDSSPPGSSPWDSPGKNTGVGCHFLLKCIKVKSQSEVAQSCLTLQSHGLQPTRHFHPWDFPGKSTGVDRQCLLWYMCAYLHLHACISNMCSCTHIMQTRNSYLSLCF